MAKQRKKGRKGSKGGKTMFVEPSPVDQSEMTPREVILQEADKRLRMAESAPGELARYIRQQEAAALRWAAGLLEVAA